MFQFPGLPPRRLYIHRRVTWVLHAGFPHSDIPGSLPAGDSPKLFAANHVLHRPIVPRHPPCALRSFNTHAISQLRDFPRLPVQLLRCQHRKRFRFRPPRSMRLELSLTRHPARSPASDPACGTSPLHSSDLLCCGAEGIRTPDPLLAKQVLSR